jgi:hypothetical protein
VGFEIMLVNHADYAALVVIKGKRKTFRPSSWSLESATVIASTTSRLGVSHTGRKYGFVEQSGGAIVASATLDREIGPRNVVEPT